MRSLALMTTRTQIIFTPFRGDAVPLPPSPRRRMLVKKKKRPKKVSPRRMSLVRRLLAMLSLSAAARHFS